MQCDGTTAQLINATKEVSCVYNQAVISQYRKGPEQNKLRHRKQCTKKKTFSLSIFVKRTKPKSKMGKYSKDTLQTC